MEIKVLNIKGEANGSKNISFPIEKQCDQAVFDQILVENCAMRQGTHSTLTKGEVSGGGIKPRPQKHSGRARQGSIRNPQWVGGGVAFGPRPNKNYTIKSNKKISQLALLSALLDKMNENAMYFINIDNDYSKPSAKNFKELIKTANINNDKNLFMLNNEVNFIKSVNNINKNMAKRFNQTSVKDIVNAKNIIINETVWDEILKIGGEI